MRKLIIIAIILLLASCSVNTDGNENERMIGLRTVTIDTGNVPREAKLETVQSFGESALEIADECLDGKIQYVTARVLLHRVCMALDVYYTNIDTSENRKNPAKLAVIDFALLVKSDITNLSWLDEPSDFLEARNHLAELLKKGVR